METSWRRVAMQFGIDKRSTVYKLTHSTKHTQNTSHIPATLDEREKKQRQNTQTLDEYSLWPSTEQKQVAARTMSVGCITWYTEMKNRYHFVAAVSVVLCATYDGWHRVERTRLTTSPEYTKSTYACAQRISRSEIGFGIEYGGGGRSNTHTQVRITRISVWQTRNGQKRRRRRPSSSDALTKLALVKRKTLSRVRAKSRD